MPGSGTRSAVARRLRRRRTEAGLLEKKGAATEAHRPDPQGPQLHHHAQAHGDKVPRYTLEARRCPTPAERAQDPLFRAGHSGRRLHPRLHGLRGLRHHGPQGAQPPLQRSAAGGTGRKTTPHEGRRLTAPGQGTSITAWSATARGAIGQQGLGHSVRSFTHAEFIGTMLHGSLRPSMPSEFRPSAFGFRLRFGVARLYRLP